MIRLIQIKGISKIFNNGKGLDDINIDFKGGCIHGVIGENGSGKTTLLRCISGIFKGDSGEVLIDNQNVYENEKIKERIAYIEDENEYFYSYRVKEVLVFYTKMYPEFSKETLKNLNTVFKIPLNARVKSLSKGQRMRLSIMLGFSIKPKLLILDEPTNGLDTLIKNEFFKMLGDYIYENNATAIITSHHLSELERVCDSITLLDKGEVKYSLELESLKNSTRKLQVVFKSDVKIKHPSISIAEKMGKVHYLIIENYDNNILEYLESLGIDFMEEVDFSLEDMFIDTIGGEYSEVL